MVKLILTYLETHSSKGEESNKTLGFIRDFNHYVLKDKYRQKLF